MREWLHKCIGKGMTKWKKNPFASAHDRESAKRLRVIRYAHKMRKRAEEFHFFFLFLHSLKADKQRIANNVTHLEKGNVPFQWFQYRAASPQWIMHFPGRKKGSRFASATFFLQHNIRNGKNCEILALEVEIFSNNSNKLEREREAKNAIEWEVDFYDARDLHEGWCTDCRVFER